MPSYDYECANCGRSEDRLVRMKERDDQTCVGCGATHATGFKRVEISIPNLDTKGSFHFAMDFGKGLVRGSLGVDAPLKSTKYRKL